MDTKQPHIDDFIPIQDDKIYENVNNEKLKELQHDVNELAEMFDDLKETIDSQDQQINVISDNIKNVDINTQLGHSELVEAQQYQSKRNYLIFGGTLVATIIGGPPVLGIKATCIIVPTICTFAAGIKYLRS